MDILPKIFVVDDSPAILDSVELILDFSGFRVEKFFKAADMLHALSNSEKPNLILLDMWLSGEDGRDVCRKIKQDTEMSQIPVIIMSASRGLEDSALESGADCFIAKPFDMENMISCVRMYIKNDY